ncbi:MAG: DNA gyrase subunit A [Deltaproteobacteria bacterium]|nr:DNA gyrase subunit A [Deltaproteobacteria bacterium]
MSDSDSTFSSNIQQKLPVSLVDEMRTSYLDYAMSVIIGRAIPDARDGLKPVHRRIMFSMHEQKIGPSGPHKKCARVVGDVIAKYHPHGDAAVYDALVRLAQDFRLRHMLIDGQGNFGSIDGDPPAAYRYTECRLTRLATELLSDIEKDTVDMAANFDATEHEPTVLPAKFPNLLVNGSEGIAVGMATSMPPHNLGEVINGTIAYIRNNDITVEELLLHIPGPDFPTAGIIYGRSGIEQAYRTGRGTVVMRARTEIEKIPGKTDREQIVVKEIPYQVNKARMHAKIGELIRDKRIEGIAEARDESDREGIRLVIELKKDAHPQVVLNQLFRMTELQTSFGVINLAIYNGRPVILDLKSAIKCFVDHRRDVVIRRTRFELRKAEADREINEGLGMAITEVDLVIKTIRESPTPDEAKQKLMNLPLRGLEEFVRRAGRPEAEIAVARNRADYRLSERQAQAILDMRLARLTGLEAEKLAAEYGRLCEEVNRLTAILNNEDLLMNVIVMELEDIRERFANKRRTEIVATEAEISVEDLIREEDMCVTISHMGYIKRTSSSTYRSQRRGGRGTMGMQAREEDFVKQLFVASTHSMVFFFSDKGKVYCKKVHEIPEAARNAKGRAVVNFVGMEPGEKIAAITPIPGFQESTYVVTVTKKGQIKKTSVLEYQNIREKGIIGVKIEDGDELLNAAVTDGNREIIIATRKGMSIRFPEEQVRAMGRATVGVKAIELDEGDEVVSLSVIEEGRNRVLAVCENGYGKRTDIDEFRLQNRGGKGVILIDASERNGPVVGTCMVKENDELMVVTDRGQTIRTKVSEIRETGRNAQGVKIMAIGEGERVVALERLEESDMVGSGDSLPPESGANGNGNGEGPGSIRPPGSDSMPPPAD